jgi:REP element-mobilizing transposase RayT
MSAFLQQSLGIPCAEARLESRTSQEAPREDIHYFLPWAEVGQSRHHLPHWEQAGTTCFATFRLADSLPHEKLEAWREERDRWLAIHPVPLSKEEEAEFRDRFEGAIQRWLDAGYGSCLLRAPAVREIVEGALRFFDGERYRLHAYVVMPNHVHVLFTPAEGRSVGRILQSWKGFTARMVNAALGREGTLWEKESWDRFIRTRLHFERTVAYIKGNPGKLGIPVYVAGEGKARLESRTPQREEEARLESRTSQEGVLGGAAFSRAMAEGARQESRTSEEKSRLESRAQGEDLECEMSGVSTGGTRR